MSPDSIERKQDIAMRNLYKQYGAGRSYSQFNKDMSAFFGGLQAAQSHGSADTRERNTNKFLSNVRAMK